jgi:hypothetical protein
VATKRLPLGKIVLFGLYVVTVFSTLFAFLALYTSFVITISFWISLISVLLAETILWRYADYWVGNVDTIKKMIPGYLGLGTVIIAYFVAVLVYSFFTGFADLALRWFILLHILTFAMAVIIGGLLFLFVRSAIDREEETNTGVVNLHAIEMALKELQEKIRSVDSPYSQEIESVMAKLIDKVHYSDPITPHSLTYMDQSLYHQIHSLIDQVTLMFLGDQELSFEAILQGLNEFSSTLARRNSQLLISK